MLKVIFFGTPSFVIPVLSSLIKNFSVVAVVTAPDKPTGRNRQLTPSPIKEYISHIGGVIKVLDAIEQLENLNPDLFVFAGYGKLVHKTVIELPTYGSLNLHPSLLPKYRGPSPIQSAILSGEDNTGITIYKMDEKLDHGPILYQKQRILKKTDTLETLTNALFQDGADALPTVIEKYISDNLKPVQQDHRNTSFTRLITKLDGFIDLKHPPSPELLDRMIRAYYPWPTVWTKLKIPNTKSPASQRDKQITNKIIKFLPDKKIQIEGKKPMSMKDFVNGYPYLQKEITELLR